MLITMQRGALQRPRDFGALFSRTQQGSRAASGGQTPKQTRSLK